MTASTSGNQCLQTLPGESVQILSNIIQSNKLSTIITQLKNYN